MALDLGMIKDHLVIENDDDDALLQEYWDAAIAYCEGAISAPIVESERTKYFDTFRPEMSLGYYVQSIVVVNYLDPDMTELVLDPSVYYLRKTNQECYLALVQGQSWPAAMFVEVTFTAGMPTTPDAIEQAVLLMIGHYYNNREASTPLKLEDIPLGVGALLNPYAKRLLG